MRVGYPSWSVEVSDEWSVIEHPECLTFELSDQSALQGSSATKKNGIVSDQDLFFSVEQRWNWGHHQECTLGEFKGIVYTYREDETTWVRWFLRNASTLLFLTYNGSHEAVAEELGSVMVILNTLRAEESRGA